MLMKVLGLKLSEKKGLSGIDFSLVFDKDKEQNNWVLCLLFLKDIFKLIVFVGKLLQLMQCIFFMFLEIQCYGRNCFGNFILSAKNNNIRSIVDLFLFEIFCLIFVGFIGYGDYVFRYLWKDEADEWEIFLILVLYISGELESGMVDKDFLVFMCLE